MAHGNDIIHNNHYHKKWQRLVRTWFNQPARKIRRSKARKEKAARIAPRPAAGPLRPIVNCPTFRYNMKVRAGRGFSLRELKRAGINRKYARTIGIAVDHRRRNLTIEGLNRNVDRLKAYRKKLIELPRNAKKEDIDKYHQLKGRLMPIRQKSKGETRMKITPEMKRYSAFHAMRQHRANAQLVGKRLRLTAPKE
ncbi:60S ribosomal protein L13 [Cichlidogyrus casuarinus]|uniref:60S ribosomal protein L13 n=1 Tax=Cichlidogyrus casuarinus TaxID=1844966 RepID=A0ABD2PRB9_9PLAT